VPDWSTYKGSQNKTSKHNTMMVCAKCFRANISNINLALMDCIS